MGGDLFVQVISVVIAAAAGAGGAYAAIRADLREAIVKADLAAKSASEAHSRIDRMHEAHR